MSSLLILEHPEHLSVLQQHAKNEGQFVGLTPYAFCELESRGLSYKKPEDYYNHDEFFSIYTPCFLNLIDILISLDTALWKVDQRFEDIGLKPFFLGGYQFQNIIDPIKIFIYLFHRILKSESPKRVSIVANKHFAKSNPESLHFLPRDPLCAQILTKLKDVYHFELNVLPAPRKEDSYQDVIKKIKKNRWLRSLLLKNLNNQNSKLSKEEKLSRTRILSLYCRDLLALEPHLALADFEIDEFPELKFYSLGRRKTSRCYEKLVENIDADSRLRALCTFENIDFFPLIREKIFAYCCSLDIFLERYQWLSALIDQKKYKIAVLNSLVSYPLENVMVVDICRKKKTPYVCWMHGGYGAYQSFEGYDMTDLLFGDHYFTYGDAVKRTIETFSPEGVLNTENKNKILTHYPLKDLKIYPAGAPHMEQQFLNYRRPENSKKVIVFIMGELWIHNQYYMGGNSPYSYFQKWEAIKSIFKKLIEFQDKYEIIIKAYRSDDKGAKALKKFLNDHNGSNIRIIKKESTIESLIERCDLTLSTWVSTTFFHAALADCDQFLFDDADLTDEAKDIISKDFYFSNDINKFCLMLDAYLREGEFYQKSKKEFRDNFLDVKNSYNRGNYISSLLRDILKMSNNKEEDRDIGSGRLSHRTFNKVLNP